MAGFAINVDLEKEIEATTSQCGQEATNLSFSALATNQVPSNNEYARFVDAQRRVGDLERGEVEATHAGKPYFSTPDMSSQGSQSSAARKFPSPHSDIMTSACQ